MSILISKEDAIDIWWHDEVFFGNQRDDMTKEQWLDYITDVIGSLPTAEPKTMNKTNANKIYSYLKERIGDIVDDMKEFDAWFERMVWHVKECDRLAVEPKTGKWIEVEDYNGDIHYQCDQCGEEFILIDGTPEDNNYWHCPNCGSYNREVRKNERV